ncbi:hypothetical protein KM043_012184 [Ampulex compressa]|nr:hypothetical protein KM043_012184 [Ampulex compressa]
MLVGFSDSDSRLTTANVGGSGRANLHKLRANVVRKSEFFYQGDGPSAGDSVMWLKGEKTVSEGPQRRALRCRTVPPSRRVSIFPLASGGGRRSCKPTRAYLGFEIIRRSAMQSRLSYEGFTPEADVVMIIN